MPADLTGAIDLHVHASPDLRPRFADALTCAEIARDAGMRGIALKNHHYSTAPLAQLVMKVVPDIDVFSYIVLNRPVGGINLAAVQAALGLGASIVSFPTMDSDHHLRVVGAGGDAGIHLSANGDLLPECKAVIEATIAADRAIATGHASPEDSLRIVRYARSRGARRLLVTHASSFLIAMSVEMQRVAAAMGALIEHAFVATHSVMEEHVTIEHIATQIRSLGPQHCVLTTDFGQLATRSFRVGLAAFMEGLEAAGLGWGEVRAMVTSQPASLVGAGERWSPKTTP